VLRQALRISEETKTALLVGAAGSGKTLLAQTIHGAGPRANRPLVTVSCTDFPESDLEEMLSPDNPDGVFAQATGGLLYLQDISALSLVAQARLYSVLFAQQQASNPLHKLNLLSGQNEMPDVQIIASSPRPLDGAVAEGMLRSDLFYLMSSMTLIVPSLSERLEDIPVLARHFLSRIRPDVGLTLAPEALVALQEANWPGNVRQLRNVLEQAAELSLTPVIPESAIRRVILDYSEDNLSAFDDARRDFERDYLIRLLQTTAGNVTHASRVAQRNRTEFYKLLARHGLDPINFKQKFR